MMRERNIRKHLVGDLSNEVVTTYLVSGEEVRDWINPALCLGGHDRVYKWIPKGEVWIEDHMSHRETDTIAYHELRERSLMLTGLTYNQAHKIAESEEQKLRHSSSAKLDSAVRRALAANVANSLRKRRARKAR
jgi:hypothetical protein